jgi:hypothetical protein
MRTSITSRKSALAMFVNITNWRISTFFPPADTEAAAADTLETSTEPSEMLSQLPDAPTEDPKDFEDVQQPSPKKQKLEDTDDDFVVVEKEDAQEDKPKSEL